MSTGTETSGVLAARERIPIDASTPSLSMNLNTICHSPSVADRPQEGPSAPAVQPLLLYIDAQRFVRECISRHLAVHLPARAIQSVASARELRDKGRWPSTSLVLLHKHAESLGGRAESEIAVIADAAPNTAVVLLSDLGTLTELERAFQLGVRGYLPTSMPLPAVIHAIRLVERGGIYVPPGIFAVSPQNRADIAATSDFSARQMQVLRLLQEGKRNSEIASELKMSNSTVKSDIRHMMRALKVSNRTQLMLRTRSEFSAA
jgi:DNA-binding NarL/FixJ family response regulator